MKITLRFFLFSGFALLFLANCSSSTVIHSEPMGASVFIENHFVGYTPYEYTDRAISFTSRKVRLEKNGFESVEFNLDRNEKHEIGNYLGGIFLFPLLWAKGYNPSRSYNLKTQN